MYNPPKRKSSLRATWQVRLWRQSLNAGLHILKAAGILLAFAFLYVLLMVFVAEAQEPETEPTIIINGKDYWVTVVNPAGCDTHNRHFNKGEVGVIHPGDMLEVIAHTAEGVLVGLIDKPLAGGTELGQGAIFYLPPGHGYFDTLDRRLVYEAELYLSPKMDKDWAWELAGLITKEFKARDLDLLLAVALCYCESSFNPNATNPETKCAGPFQLHPMHNIENVYDPEVNVYWGAEKLRKYIDENGTIWRGLNRYGTNTGRVIRIWEDLNRHFDHVDTTEVGK